ncbi:MAG: 50S ribosomal protein L22 [Patescibacteria group bacterium]|nr:50S ribosomal protein L22 [Patescibacteria group bacterium]
MKAKVQARLNNFRRSAQKVRQSSPIIKGLNVVDAVHQLEHSRKGDAEALKKLLQSAIANAENNHDLDKSNLYVFNFIVEEGKTLKRWRPRAYGRAAQILKRTCNVVLTLEEIKEGKDGKRGQGRAKKAVQPEEKAKGERIEEKEETGKDVLAPVAKKLDLKGVQPSKGVIGKKVFRRKSF